MYRFLGTAIFDVQNGFPVLIINFAKTFFQGEKQVGSCRIEDRRSTGYGYRVDVQTLDWISF